MTASTAGASTTISLSVIPSPAGPPVAVRFEQHIAIVDSQTTATLFADVRDRAGLSIAGQTVAFTSRDPSIANVSASGVVTGLRRGTTAVIASVPGGVGITHDSVLVVVVAPEVPVFYATLPGISLKTDTTVTIPVLADMRSSATRLGAGRVSIVWDPSLLEYVSSTAGSSGVSATVNSTNAATGSFVLAFANPAGFSGKVELQRLVFKVATSGARLGSLQVTAGEAFASNTFADLKALAVSVSIPFITR